MSNPGETKTPAVRDYWAPHVTVAAVVEYDGKFLMVEESILGKRVLTQPAGHLDPDETLSTAVIREVREEAGLVFEPSALVGIYRWVNPVNDGSWLRFTFTGDIIGSREPSPQDADILKAAWIDESQLRAQPERLRSPQVLAGIDDYNAGIRFDLALLQDMQ